MGGWNNKQADAITFPQILLGHYNKINQISLREFKVTEKILVIDGNKVIQESENVSKVYCQAVLQLSYILLPYFDKTVKEETKIHLPILQGFGYEIIEKIEDKDFKKRVDAAAEGTPKDDLIIMFQVRSAQKLFCALSLLLKRVDYLAKSVFGDTEVDDNVIDDEEDVE